MPIEVLPPAVIASVAAVIDIRSRRIPNWLTLSAFAGGVVLHGVLAGPSGALYALAGAALGLGLLLPFYVMRAIGAGDVKLLAALGALLGPQTLVSVAIYAAIVGGLISVVMLSQRGVLRRTLADVVTRPLRMARSGAKAPYGVAIAGGVYLSLLLPSVLG